MLTSLFFFIEGVCLYLFAPDAIVELVICEQKPCTISDLTWMKKPRHATRNPKVITVLTEDYKALMLRKLIVQTRISIVPSALTELDVTGHD
jgi:hypothetical protein